MYMVKKTAERLMKICSMVQVNMTDDPGLAGWNANQLTPKTLTP